MSAPILRCGSHAVSGVSAEVLSVLEVSSLWAGNLSAAVTLEECAAALDTSRPAEERVAEAVRICRRVKQAGRLARWIPWFDGLPEAEYSGRFFPNYRDHTIHSLNVLLLGMYLFETVTALRVPLLARLRAGVTDLALSDEEVFLEWWLLVSIWHDSAYSFEASEFLADAKVREDVLSRYSARLGTQPFSEGFASSGLALTQVELRRIYRAGSFYPIKFDSVSALLSEKLFQETTDALWRRMGVGRATRGTTTQLDELTREGGPERPPYHDHGMIAAALVAQFASEAESFLAALVEEDGSSAAIPGVGTVAEEGWSSFVGLSGVLRLGIEAIAFHNLDFGRLAASAGAAELLPAGFETSVSLREEPHLFFTAVADTLQDWDRHHFAPRGFSASYRPSIPASSMLLQGDGAHLRIAIDGTSEPVSKVRALFERWLDANDQAELFRTEPTFSRPERLEAGIPTKLDRIAKSEEERKRLCLVIGKAAEESRRVLIADESDSVLRVSVLFQSVSRQLADASILTHTDSQAVAQFLADSGLRRLQSQASALIDVGCRLQLGRVLRPLGEGGFGRVFEIEANGGTRHSYAFKLYHERDLGDPEKLRLFRRGFEAMRALNDHPNVVSVVEFSEVPLGFYMEFISGPNLEQAIEQFEEIHERLEVGRTVIETVDAAHNRPVQVLHRDIKPANVLLDTTRSMTPVLTDFDLAWIESRRTEFTKQLYANLHYGAPEQFEPRWREFREKPAVDIYALGALLYFLALKQTPPHWRDWSEVHWRHIYDRLNGELSFNALERLVRLLREMTKPDPRERVISSARVATEVARICALAARAEQRLSKADWEGEVVFRTSGRAGADNRTFLSRTGSIGWSLSSTWDKASKTLQVETSFGLEVGARFERITYQQYRTAAARRIDERLKEFMVSWPEVSAVRRGFPTETARATIQFKGVPLTLESAVGFSQLLVHVNQAIE